MLHTNDNYYNDLPIKRKAFFGAGLLEIYLSCQLKTRVFVCRCDILERTDQRLSDRGDPVGKDLHLLECFPQYHLCKLTFSLVQEKKLFLTSMYP